MWVGSLVSSRLREMRKECDGSVVVLKPGMGGENRSDAAASWEPTG